MRYYHVKLSTGGESFDYPDVFSIKDNDWLYFSDKANELFIVTYDDNNRSQLYDKVQSLSKDKVTLEEYTSLSETDFIAKVGEDRLGMFASFLLRKPNEVPKMSLVPNPAVLSELDNIIGLADFKKKVQHLISYLDYQTKLDNPPKKEAFFFILNGEIGSGRKYAIRFLEGLFELTSVVTNWKEFVIPKTTDKEFPVVYDALASRPRAKLEFLTHVNTKKGCHFSVFIANSSKEAKEIKAKLSETYYKVEIIDFPDYKHDELLAIANQMLSERQINVSQDDLAGMVGKEAGVSNAKEIRQLVQTIYDFVAANDYTHSDDQVIDLSDLVLKSTSSHIAGNAQKKLSNMIGLDSVKALLEQQLAFSHLSKLRHANGFPVDKTCRHLIFSGNSGTSKTEVARLYTEIMYDNGLISENKLVEVGRSELIGEYVGHTTPKVKSVFDRSSGGVLFIDEAYSLIPQSERDFANEAIPTIIQEMENRRDEVIVIFAGYPHLMQEFIASNPGLESRIARQIHFDDYSVDELYAIFQLMIRNRGYTHTRECREPLLSHFSTMVTSQNFGNGRYVRKLIEAALYHQAVRVMRENSPTSISKEEMNEIVEDDIKAAIRSLNIQETKSNQIGFGLH